MSQVISSRCPACGSHFPVSSHASTTTIAAIIDKSGSMSNLQLDTIGGFNTFLKEQKALPDAATMHVALFDTTVQHLVRNTPIATVPELTTSTYRPSGNTALLDAVGQTISELSSATGRVIVLIITDGQENSSREYVKPNQIKEMIEAKQKQGWEFIFIGADASAWSQGASMGIHTVGQYTASAAGTSDLYHAVTANVSSMRATGASAATMDWMVIDKDDKDKDKDKA